MAELKTKKNDGSVDDFIDPLYRAGIHQIRRVVGQTGKVQDGQVLSLRQ